MKPLYVHVGLPRAGSTFFQNRVFKGKKGIRYIGKTQDDYPEWLMKWHYLPTHEFSEEADRIRSTVTRLCSSTEPNVLSSEMFTMWGGRASDQARRLHQLFPEAKIVIVLREPISRMVSFYKAIVERDGFFQPLKNMIDWKELPFVDYKRKPVQIGDFQYDRLVASYRTLFGEDHVCVVRLEDMKATPHSFWGQLSDFSRIGFGAREVALSKETTVNASPSHTSVGQLRWENFRRSLGELQSDLQSVFDESRQPGWGNEEILPTSLRSKLLEALRHRCGAYYHQSAH